MIMPRDFTVNGIDRLGITVFDGSQYEPLQENSMDFTGLAFAIHAGLSLLEKPSGRDALQKLGHTVVEEWYLGGGEFRFRGDSNLMAHYVHFFLDSVRKNFPRVILDSSVGPDVTAHAKRIPGHVGDLSSYNPKKAAGIYYNRSLVSNMASAGLQSNDNETVDVREKMAFRFKLFLFKFAVSTAHELAHLFVGYLAQGQDTTESYTPPSVSYLNYAGMTSQTGVPLSGESGRWMESRLFGGSIEFYRDISDDQGQAGIPYLVGVDAHARQIHPNCIVQLVTGIEAFSTFPLATTGDALTFVQRREKGLLSLGSTQPSGSQPSGPFMRSRREGPGPLYNISASELRRVPLEPTRPLSKTQVAY